MNSLYIVGSHVDQNQMFEAFDTQPWTLEHEAYYLALDETRRRAGNGYYRQIEGPVSVELFDAYVTALRRQ